MWWAGAALAATPGAWEGLIVTVAPSEESRVRVWFDAHARRNDGFLAIVRPGLGLDVGGGVTLWGGYAWVATVDPGLVSEHRVWEQVTWNRSGKGIAGGLRGRLEQRFGEGRGIGVRFRGFGRLQLTVVDAVSLVVWDEAFVGLNDAGWGTPGVNQNRVFLGPALTAGPIRAEVGGLGQHVLRDGAWSFFPSVATNLFVSL